MKFDVVGAVVALHRGRRRVVLIQVVSRRLLLLDGLATSKDVDDDRRRPDVVRRARVVARVGHARRSHRQRGAFGVARHEHAVLGVVVDHAVVAIPE